MISLCKYFSFTDSIIFYLNFYDKKCSAYLDLNHGYEIFKIEQ